MPATGFITKPMGDIQAALVAGPRSIVQDADSAYARWTPLDVAVPDSADLEAQ
jgi:hypothetical protein